LIFGHKLAWTVVLSLGDSLPSLGKKQIRKYYREKLLPG
jgi:hypothetical protein